MATVANINELLVNQTTPMTVARYTPQSARANFSVMSYLRVLAPITMLIVELTYADGSGSQSQLIAGGTYAPGAYTLRPIYIAATNAADVVLTVTADAINAVRVSAVFKDQ